MSDVLIPPWVQPQSPEHIVLLDDQTLGFQPGLGRGPAQIQIWADPRWQFKRTYKATRMEERATLRSAMAEARGKGNIIRATVHQPLRGSFPASELLANPTFANGTTGWGTPSDARLALSASDRMLRLTLATQNQFFYTFQNISGLTANVPYALRFFAAPGRLSSALTAMVRAQAGSTEGGSDYGVAAAVAYGMVACAFVPPATSAYCNAVLATSASTGQVAGDYFLLPFGSLARCALIDNSPNSVLQSDDITSGSWTKTAATTSANTAVSPDGSSTADSLIEDSSASTPHHISQTVTKTGVAQDWCGVGYFKSNSRSQIRMLVGGVSGDFAQCFFDFSNGTISSGPTVVGAVTNARAFITNVGNGWYRCALIANVPSSVTTANALDVELSVGNNASYSGNGAGNLFVWRLGYAQSSMPFLPGQTTAAATTGTSQSGSALQMKGLPVSTNGLLEVDDFFEINGELKQCTARLNSDAGGLGYLLFRPAIASSPADNDPVIINQPFGRFRLTAQFEYDSSFGLYADADLELTEVYG